MSPNNNNNLAEAKQRISKAISIGAPAYNSGDIKQCATIYKETAKDIAPLVPSSFQTKLLKEVEEEDTNNANNFDTKAWALRRLFDTIVDYQLPLTPQDVGQKNTSYEPFTPQQIGEPINVMDSVMGGISQGGWMPKTNTFYGVTSLANNGGFASIRWRFNTIQNWSYAKGIYIKGLKHSNVEEHTFRIILKDSTCERVRLSNYKAVFANPVPSSQQQTTDNDNTDDDQVLLIPFTELDKMEQMGRGMEGSPSFNPLEVTEIGLMAIKPTVVGEFQLEFTEWGLYI